MATLLGCVPEPSCAGSLAVGHPDVDFLARHACCARFPLFTLTILYPTGALPSSQRLTVRGNSSTSTPPSQWLTLTLLARLHWTRFRKVGSTVARSRLAADNTPLQTTGRAKPRLVGVPLVTMTNAQVRRLMRATLMNLRSGQVEARLPLVQGGFRRRVRGSLTVCLTRLLAQRALHAWGMDIPCPTRHGLTKFRPRVAAFVTSGFVFASVSQAMPTQQVIAVQVSTYVVQVAPAASPSKAVPQSATVLDGLVASPRLTPLQASVTVRNVGTMPCRLTLRALTPLPAGVAVIQNVVPAVVVLEPVRSLCQGLSPCSFPPSCGATVRVRARTPRCIFS